MSSQDRISIDPAVCHGKACIKGTRVMVSVVPGSLAARETPKQIATACQITMEDVKAALANAVDLAKERA